MSYLAFGYNMELCGVEMGWLLKPVHNISISSKLVTGIFPVAISPGLLIRVVDLLLEESSELDSPGRHLYPACVVTRSQARRNNQVALSDSILVSTFSDNVGEEDRSETELAVPADAVAEPVIH